MSHPTSQRLTTNHIPEGQELGDEDVHTLLRNNSQETRTLRSDLWALESQVFLLCFVSLQEIDSSLAASLIELNFNCSCYNTTLSSIQLVRLCPKS